MTNHYEDEEFSHEISVQVVEEETFVEGEVVVEGEAVVEGEDDTNWAELSWERDTEFQLILDNLDKAWRWSALSLFRRWTEISAHPMLTWDLKEVSRNITVTENIVLENLDFPWNHEGLSENSNISFEFMMQHPEWNWSWKGVSLNRSLKIEHVLSHMELDWDWEALSGFNSSIKIDDIEAHIELPWIWSVVLYNSTFNREFVDRNPELGFNLREVNYFLAHGDSAEFERLENLRLEQASDSIESNSAE